VAINVETYKQQVDAFELVSSYHFMPSSLVKLCAQTYKQQEDPPSWQAIVAPHVVRNCDYKARHVKYL
jgi:hypothetical protein